MSSFNRRSETPHETMNREREEARMQREMKYRDVWVYAEPVSDNSGPQQDEEVRRKLSNNGTDKPLVKKQPAKF